MASGGGRRNSAVARRYGEVVRAGR
jgi:hypothetical protein